MTSLAREKLMLTSLIPARWSVLSWENVARCLSRRTNAVLMSLLASCDVQPEGMRIFVDIGVDQA